ncbi:unnamed protein product, partial [Ectocarpus sp. 12 AP-2014]
MLHTQGKHAEAESVLVRATEIWEGALGPKHPHVALALSNRALMLYDQGKYDQAESLIERSV